MSALSTTLERRPGIDREAFRLKAEGVAVPDIGTKLDLPDFLVERLIRHAASKQRLDKSNRRTAERAVQLARLEELYAALRQPALEGDTKACQRILEVLSRQSSLLGLDAPKESVQVVVEGNYEAWLNSVRKPALTDGLETDKDSLRAQFVVIDDQPSEPAKP